MIKSDFLHVVDKEWGHHSYYRKHAIGLTIETQTNNNIVTLKEARLYDGAKVYAFNDVEDLVEYLRVLTCSWTKETQLIYCNDLRIAKYILHNHITNSFQTAKSIYAHYLLGGKIEVRDIYGFIQDIATAKKDLDCDDEDCVVLQRYGQRLIDMFCEEKFAYLTIYQKLRKDLHKSWKNSGVTLEEDSYYIYQEMIKAKRGGMCFIHWPCLEIDEPILGVDRTSAYPCDLLLEKYPMTRFKSGDSTNWRKYLNDDYAFFGTFTINYDSNFDHYFSCVYAENAYCLPRGVNQTVTLTLTNVDILTIEKILDIRGSIKCRSLFVAKKDYLPEYITNELIKRYTAKSALKGDKDMAWKYRQVKLELNAFTGNLQRKLSCAQEYKNREKGINPAWGIWLTAYGRHHLVELAVQVNDRFYGDTDSIFCSDSVKNREVIANHNLKHLQKIKDVCALRGWDISTLCDLGKFALEHTITHFYASKQKQYGYITTAGEEIVKCSGYERGSISYERLINMNLPQMNIKTYYIDEDDCFRMDYITREEYLHMMEMSERGIY